jgi:DNA repair protein RadD
MELRAYQLDALEGLFNYWESGQGTNALVVAPTGSGKGVIIGEFCRRVCVDSPHVKILVVTHVRELIVQNASALKRQWEEANIGVYSAGLGKRSTSAQIVFCGIQSVYKRAFEFGKVDIVIIDEVHLVSREAETRYGRFLSDIKKANPHVVLWGTTATPYRLSEGLLHEGEGALFDGIAFVCEMKQLVAQGYLVPAISKGGVSHIDLTDVHIRAGEFMSDELAHAADDPLLIKKAVAEIVTYGKDRKAWLIFCAGVAHAEHVKTEVETHGIRCDIITGETPKQERDATTKAFKEGKLKCLINVSVLTTGFDAPITDLIALLTSTNSTGRYVQIVGRGLRTYPEKENLLLLDFGGNVLRHGKIDDVDPVRTRNVFNVEKKAPPMKECPQCHVILYAREMLCPACGYEFPSVAPHGTSAYDGDVMSAKKEAFFVDVAETYYERSKRAGRPDILKIGMYDKMDKEFPLWCCLEHTGYAKEKANQLVKQFGGTATNVAEALKESDYWRRPKRIKVIPNGKFFNVLGIEFLPARARQQTLDFTSQASLGDSVGEKDWGALLKEENGKKSLALAKSQSAPTLLDVMNEVGER